MQADVVGNRELAFAVCKPTRPPAFALSYRPMERHFVNETASDEMLLSSVADGDKAAMHIMFARHRAKVFSFIHRIVRDPGIADDIVSQVFLDVWRAANRFEGRSRVSTWLLSIARFKALNLLKQRTHETIDQDHVLEVADSGDSPEAVLDRKETNGILQASMNKLSPAHREIIELFYFRDKSIAEVSKMIGIPQATVKSRVFYARKHLARILVDAGFEAAAGGDRRRPAGPVVFRAGGRMPPLSRM